MVDPKPDSLHQALWSPSVSRIYLIKACSSINPLKQ